jgi:hypothetical protein
MNKILNSTKELLGVPLDVTEFDTQLVMHINSALSSLDQIGLGADSKYQITLTDGDLEDFLPLDIHGQVQMYIYTKVRLIFDPPATAFVLTALQQSLAELEWRLKDYAETEGT